MADPAIQTELTALPARNALYSVRGVPGTLEADLRSQLEAAVEFADYCAFLTAGTGSDQAAQLVNDAHALYDDTMNALQHHGRPELTG